MKLIFFAIAFLLITLPALRQSSGQAFGQIVVPTQTVPVSMTWTDNQPAGPGEETGFNIYRCAGVNCTNFAKVGSVGPNVVKYSEIITGDLGNRTFRYQVTAFNDGGESAASNIVTFLTPYIIVVKVKPGAPSGLLGSIVGVTVP